MPVHLPSSSAVEPDKLLKLDAKEEKKNSETELPALDDLL
jgi:hypothetical protein